MTILIICDFNLKNLSFCQKNNSDKNLIFELIQGIMVINFCIDLKLINKEMNILECPHGQFSKICDFNFKKLNFFPKKIMQIEI